MPLEAAIAYAERHDLHALVVARAETILCERYGEGYDREKAHPLYSGTKSFWGVLALAAQEDGLLTLDEPVCDTLHEWRSDETKTAVTIRQLLQLTAGFAFGGLGNAVPTYEAAIALPLRDPPGARFTYGGVPLQIFGALLARKLESRLTPHEYLHERLLAPLGIAVASWRSLKDGTHPLPTGAQLSPAAWLRYGQFLGARGKDTDRHVIDPQLLRVCWAGTTANPRYGLAFWLDPTGGIPDLLYASGAAGQALYVIPSADLTVVHFGKSTSFRHETFLRRLLPL
jgi:CubicO group peptidase (beta-lactamase class C family)